jgi:hypothetical protein
MSKDTRVKTVCKLCEMKNHIDWDCTDGNFPTNCPYNKLHREVEDLKDELQILLYKKKK